MEVAGYLMPEIKNGASGVLFPCNLNGASIKRDVTRSHDYPHLNESEDFISMFKRFLVHENPRVPILITIGPNLSALKRISCRYSESRLPALKRI